jgi:hypothetical protein
MVEIVGRPVWCRNYSARFSDSDLGPGQYSFIFLNVIYLCTVKRRRLTFQSEYKASFVPNTVLRRERPSDLRILKDKYEGGDYNNF